MSNKHNNKAMTIMYSMSETGTCPRVLAAQRLGYDPMPETKDSEILLKHATRCEDLAAAQIMDMGYRLESGGLCMTCKEQYGNERYGIHVELDTPLFNLVGHLDRRLLLENDDRRLPVEIKSLGKYTWTKFSNGDFAEFPEYAAQMACYAEAEKSPGIYWVMNRDNGQPLKYIVNDFNNEINLDGFQKIVLPITYDQIVENLNAVEISVQYNELPVAEPRGSCYFCRYGFLCSKPDTDKKTKIENIPYLNDAAAMYKKGREMEKQASEMIDGAKDALLLHAKKNKLDKYRAGGVSVSYRGQKTKIWLDEKIIRAEAPPDLIRLATRESAPWDDCTIRILKEEE